jgi:hypothetical protein
MLGDPLSEVDGQLSQHRIPTGNPQCPFANDGLGSFVQQLQYGVVFGIDAPVLGDFPQLSIFLSMGLVVYIRLKSRG